MSDAKSNYLEDAIIDHVLRNTALTSPTTVYLALYTSNPAEDNSGTEATGGSYARQATAFGAPSNGVSTNSAEETFAAMPAGTFTHFGVLDALTVGNLLYFGELDESITVNAGDDIVFPIGSLSIQEK